MTWLRTRKTVSTGLLIGLALFTTGVQAQQSADDKAIVAAVDGANAAISSRDIGKLASIWAQEPYVMLANPRDKMPSFGWDAVKKDWETAFAFWSDFKVTRTGEVQVHATPSVSWSVSTADVQGRTKDDKALSFKVIQTDVFEKRGDRWLLVSHHASRIPD
jgi:ketosteroid isomerase-like protein